jgi:hypothetical protein
MKRLLAVAWPLLVPFWAVAQDLALAPPRLGEALRTLDRVERASPGLEQQLVLPERAGQNRVAWYDFEWRHFDAPPPGGGPGGVRLYFYAREREVAERALPVIRGAFVRLVDQFHYSPTKVIPYILYSSKREFQSTNVFQVSESVLGVTSPQDLKMSLPYFGDQERFREVSTHEMVHQFTIQKLMDASGSDFLPLVESLPLWFVEGIAEYYAKGGLDVETEGFLRDLVWNPDPEHKYEILPFAEDRIRGYVPTYKLGQARVAFVAEVYGKEKIQAFLENAHVMGSATGSAGAERSFAALVRRVLNEDLSQVDARWRTWLKKRYYAAYVRTRQDVPQVHLVPEAPHEIEAYAASPDGTAVLARQIDRDRGQVSLYLLDPRRPGSAVKVTGDNRPGVESLHPIDQSTLAVSNEVIAFAAQDGPTDSLYLQPWRRRGPSRSAALELGKRRKVAVVHPAGLHFIEVSDLAFSQDGSHVAFVALTEEGHRDIYVVPAEGGAARQLTDDAYDERDLYWGPDGIYCSSDATDHGHSNLFRIDPGSGARTRLTTWPAEDRHPVRLEGGAVVFSSDAGGKPDLYLLEGDRVRRLTDFTTGLSNPSPLAAGRGFYAQTFQRGRFHLVEVPRGSLLDDPPAPVLPPAGPPLAIPEDPVPADAPAYRGTSLASWKAENGFVVAGGGSGFFGGRAAVIFADLLRDQIVYLDLAVVGSLDYTQALLLYLNRSGRTTWALAFSHFVQLQFDTLDPTLSYLQRQMGISGELRFPLNRYQRFDVDLTLGGINRFCLTDESADIPLACVGMGEGPQTNHPAYPNGDPDWNRRNSGFTPTLTPSLRYGFDNVRFDFPAGPIDGSSILLEVGGSWLPTRSAVNGYARGDLSTWFRLVDRAKLMLRFAFGTSFAPNDVGRTWAQSWWVSAPDNLRGFYPLDLSYLVGQHYYVANAELHFPLEWLLRVHIFDYLAGVMALDFGSVFNDWHATIDPITNTVRGPWASRTLTGVLGVNVVLGPFLLRFHFGHPFDIGGQPTPALIDHVPWVFNFTLRYFFF